jgi:ATP-dependent Lon protease
MLTKLFTNRTKFIAIKRHNQSSISQLSNNNHSNYVKYLNKIVHDTNIDHSLKMDFVEEYCKNWNKYDNDEFELFKDRYEILINNDNKCDDDFVIKKYIKEYCDKYANNPNAFELFKLRCEIICREGLEEGVKKLLLDYHDNLYTLSKDALQKRIEWINYVLQLPTEYKNTRMDLHKIKSTIDSKIFKMDHAKDDIMSAIYAYKNKSNTSNNTIALYGSSGVGKTALIRHLAMSVDLPFVHISVGNINDSSYLVGSAYTYQYSQPGHLVKSIIKMGYKNGIILLDEIDKLSNSSRGNEILGILMHLCDPTQNNVFDDKYLDGIPIDFSNYIFVYSLNNMEIMNPALLSRIGQNIIKIEDYTLDDKIAITKLYIIPDLIKHGEIIFNDDIIKYIIDECIPLKSKGIRELKAQIIKIIRMVRYYNALEKKGYIFPLVLDKVIIGHVLNKVV